MIKRFCDLCEKEIKESYYEITIYEIEEPLGYKKGYDTFLSVCNDCYSKIFKKNKKESH